MIHYHPPSPGDFHRGIELVGLEQIHVAKALNVEDV
jgi:hypothetical protein